MIYMHTKLAIICELVSLFYFVSSRLCMLHRAMSSVLIAAPCLVITCCFEWDENAVEIANYFYDQTEWK